MTRTVLTGGVVFDGTGTAPSPADVAIEDGHEGLGTVDSERAPGVVTEHQHRHLMFPCKKSCVNTNCRPNGHFQS